MPLSRGDKLGHYEVLSLLGEGGIGQVYKARDTALDARGPGCYYNVTKEPNGDQLLIITTIVEDPKNLNQSFITSTHFKKEPDGSKWSPTSCTSR